MPGCRSKLMSLIERRTGAAYKLRRMRKIDQAINENSQEITLTALAEAYYARIEEPLIKRLQARIRNPRNVPGGFYEKLLEDDGALLKKLVLTPPLQIHNELIPQLADLCTLYKVFIKKHSTGNPDKAIKAEIISVLGYPKIRATEASWLIQRLKIKSCPYCGAQFILSFSSGRKQRVLCELDHFYPKDEHPLLCISFFNLIPSCSACNRVKSHGKTCIHTYPHPYLEDLDSLFRFTTDAEGDIRSILDQKSTISIQLEPRGSNHSKINSHIKRFYLKELYLNHADIIQEIYWKKHVYTNSRKQELERVFGDQLGLTANDIDRFILGNYTEKVDLLRRPLAKLIRDIGLELGLIRE